MNTLDRPLNRFGAEDEPTSCLAKAIAIWQSGRYPGMRLIADLIDEGYDVPSLENAYFNAYASR